MLKIEAETVHFEHCIGCASHHWCTNHDEAKYKKYFNLAKNAILETCKSVNVVENQIPLGFANKFIEISQVSKPGKVHFPRIGSFEVYFRGKRIFSKLETGKWPNVSLLSTVIKNKIEEDTSEKPKEKILTVKKQRSQSTKRRRPVTDMKKKLKKRTKRVKKVRLLEEDSNISQYENQKDLGYKADIFKVSHDYRNIPIDSPEGTLNFEKPQNKPEIRQVTPPNPFKQEVHKKPPSLSSSSSSEEEYQQPLAIPRGHHSFNGKLNKSSSESSSQYNEDFDAEGDEEHDEKPQESHEESEEEEYEQDEYSEDSDKEEEEYKNEHPNREITKSYNVELPAGKPSKKKITYQNVNSSDSEFCIISSHPEYMEIKENYVTIKRGMKEKFQLKFIPLDEPGERIYYLYIDRDGEPWECIQIKADYQ